MNSKNILPFFSRSPQRTKLGSLVQWPGKKGIINLVAWSFAIFFMIWIEFLYLDDEGKYTNPNNLEIAIWIGSSNVLILMICYYWITRIVIPQAIRQRWLLLAVHILFFYIFSMLARHYATVITGYFYEGINQRFDTRAHKYALAGPFNTTFGLMFFFDNWFYLYSILLAPVCLHVVKEIYLSRNRALQLELNLLRAQINPHFILNSLNNIYSIVEEKDAYAADMLLKFSHILRYTFYETDQDFIGLQAEVNSLTDYVALERIRHDSQVQLDLTVNLEPNSESVPIPPLLLVSLVENAFKHGVNATIGASWVRIELTASPSAVYFEVVNSKPPTHSANPGKDPRFGHQLGLSNIKRRLELLYNQSYNLLITDSSDTYSLQLTLSTDGKTNNLYRSRRRAASPKTA